MRKLDALKKLAVKLGLDSSVDNFTESDLGELINAIAEKIEDDPIAKQESIGDLDNLETTAKDNVVNAINELAAIPTEITIKSSTAESTKKFKITVVDDGTISATEIQENV